MGLALKLKMHLKASVYEGIRERVEVLGGQCSIVSNYHDESQKISLPKKMQVQR